MLSDEISDITRGTYQVSHPCPDIVHGLTPEIRKHAPDCPVGDPDPLAVCTCSGEEQEVLVDAQGIGHEAIREDCPNCHKSELRTKDDYICYRCRQHQCSKCGGTGLVAGLVGGGNALPAFYRTVRSAANNALLATEAKHLHRLREEFESVGKEAFLPHLVETQHVANKRTNIFLDDGWELYSLEEIRQRYPNGVDPKDMAWMFRRLLLVLGLANGADIAHGAILPPNVLIEPEAHGLVLANWAHSVERPGRITSIVKAYRDWYPPEVFARQNILGGTDIYMAAKCMIYLMEGQSVPPRMVNFLAGCMNPDATKRPNSAKVVFDQFNDLLEEIWGPRTFHPFSMKRSDGAVISSSA